MKAFRKMFAITGLALLAVAIPAVGYTQEPEYTKVTSFSGSSDKTTESFTIDSEQWRVRWLIEPANDFKVFYLYVYEEGRDFPIESITAGEQNSDTSVIREGPGKFYIEVAAANLVSWGVTIEQAPKSAKEANDEKPKDKSSCFVATAAYGTPMAEDIDVLRTYRDDVLADSPHGQAFIDWYYQNGPVAADFIANRPILRFGVRELVLRPMVGALRLTEGSWK